MSETLKPAQAKVALPDAYYAVLLEQTVALITEARRLSTRTVNVIMTATYWEVGRRIVEHEQNGQPKAEYGVQLLARLAQDLTARFGRGFGPVNLSQMRKIYLLWPADRILQTMSEKSARVLRQWLCAPAAEKLSTLSAISQTTSEISGRSYLWTLARSFPLSWSHYVRLLSVKSSAGRAFYETEALRGGWSVRQLDRQMDSQFYERTALSKNKAAMLRKGGRALPTDTVTPEEEIKDPLVLEFLGLKDEYSESDLEEALIRHLEAFLLELGGDFAFVGRQRRLRIDDEWYRVDLLFFHRRLRCLVVIDLKLGKLTHADAGQMHMYLNYAREHWTRAGENPPVGLILCAQKGASLARYALEGLPNKVLAAEYRTALPDERTLTAELDKTRAILEHRK